jgi:hypothetical protein
MIKAIDNVLTKERRNRKIQRVTAADHKNGARVDHRQKHDQNVPKHCKHSKSRRLLVQKNRKVQKRKKDHDSISHCSFPLKMGLSRRKGKQKYQKAAE